MGVNKQSARIKHHTSTTSGSFTVPASEDFTDGSWDKWDLAKSEIAVNDNSTKVFVRIGSAIKEFSLVDNSPEVIQLACSDETTALTTGTAKITFRMPYAMELEEVRASLTGAGSTGGTTTVDINESGTTILSTKLTIDQGEKTSETATTPPVISDSTLADDAEITIDIDTVTTGADETGLKVTLIGRRA
jgi:hypothetical protein